MNRKLLLVTLLLFGALVMNRGRGHAQVEFYTSPLTNANQPYWPSFGYDRQNTSRSLHPGPQTAEIAWTYPAVKGRVINQQPTVDADGTVYFATWGSYVGGVERARGLLYALNPDGTQKRIYDWPVYLPGLPAPGGRPLA
jgi:outer membrane protein assembly factor BamB